jgi:SAM-dependent methyltransferase
MIKGYHQTRFGFDERRERLWATLCESYFQKLIAPEACVLELGAGYGHFINNIRCRRKVALDSWSGMPKFLKPDVESIVSGASDLSAVEDNSVDFAFASNLFEHLTQEQLAATLEQLRNKLRETGTLNILQPNYRFAYREYFDDYTHISVFSDRSLVDFLNGHGFRILECQPRFLPLTIKSRLPVFPALIRVYLWLPFKPMGKQMLIRASRA